MRIGDLSARTGASPRSLRYYEERGLIASERSPSGQRRYPPDAVERVALIRQLLGAGLGTEVIGEVLPCVRDPRRRTPWLAEHLGQELERIDEQIQCLQGTRETLTGVIADYREDHGRSDR